MTPQQAVEAPRFATFSYPRSSAPHSYDPGLMKLEARIDPAVIGRLIELGHDAQSWPDWEWTAGAVCTVLADETNGRKEGAADPRRPSAGERMINPELPYPSGRSPVLRGCLENRL